MKIKLKGKLSPTQIIALGFLLTIFIGSILLKLPISHKGDLSYIDSLFTATSAACVTGHSTVDVEATFTLFGQIVIMLLIQIGGLGFLVWEDISNCVGSAIREKTSIKRAIKKLTLHTKLVLIFQVLFNYKWTSFSSNTIYEGC